MSAILPAVSMTMSRMTSPLVPRGKVERSGFGVGKKLARAMLILPEPSASASAVESGCVEVGEVVFGDASVVFKLFVSGVGSGVAVACFGAVLGFGVEVCRGARPGE